MQINSKKLVMITDNGTFIFTLSDSIMAIAEEKILSGVDAELSALKAYLDKGMDLDCLMKGICDFIHTADGTSDDIENQHSDFVTSINIYAAMLFYKKEADLINSGNISISGLIFVEVCDNIMKVGFIDSFINDIYKPKNLYLIYCSANNSDYVSK